MKPHKSDDGQKCSAAEKRNLRTLGGEIAPFRLKAVSLDLAARLIGPNSR